MGFLGWRRATDEIWLGPLDSWFHPPDSEQLPAIDRSGRHDGPEAGAVASGAPAVQADATKVGVGQPRDTAGAVQSGAPGVAARAQTVPADAAVVHEVSADVVSGAPSVAADADRIEAGQADAAATAGAGAPALTARAENGRGATAFGRGRGLDATHDSDDLSLFISRRADLRRVLSRLHGGIGVLTARV